MNIITTKISQFMIGNPSLILLGFILSFSAPANATLNCPNVVSVNIDQCDIFYTMDWNVVQWSSTVPLADTTFSPFQGTFLPPGAHTATIIGTDFNGSNSTCNFIISVVQPPPMMECNNLIQVSLQNDCNEPITPDMVLSPNSNICIQDALLQVQTQLGNVLGVGNPVLSSSDWIGLDLVVQLSDLGSGLTCWSDLQITTPTEFNLMCPADITVLCVEPNDPSVTGLPLVQSCFEESQLIFSYEDFEGQQFCPSPLSYINTRSWTVENPAGEKKTCQQKVTGKRFQLAQLLFPENFDNSQQPALDCVHGLSANEVADTAITGVPTISGYSADQPVCEFSVGFTDTNIPLCGESYRIQRKWVVTDLCTSQKREQIQVIEIQDNQPPVFSIPDTVWVSSDSDCGNEANLPPAVIIDECSDISYQIQTPWSTIFQNGGPANIQQINGTHSITYTLTDGCGNSSSQTSFLVVNPQTLVSCPGNVTIDCNIYFSELEAPLSSGNYSVLDQFGDAEFHSNCDPDISETVQVNVDECGIGVIERNITTTSFSFPQSCSQQIHVIHQSDFVASFPADITVICTNVPQDFGEPQVFGDDCEQIAISFTDQVFTTEPDACYKIIRTWQVINPCIYNPNFGNLTVESSEMDLGGINCDLDGNGVCNERTFQDGLTSNNYPNAIPDGYIEYQQVIKVNDSFAPEFLPYNIDPICVTANNCGALVNIPVPEVLDCSQTDIVVNSDLGNGFGPFAGVAPGTYNATFTAVDLCGNTTIIQRQIAVVDCQKPDAKCHPNLIVELSNTNPPSAEVFAFETNIGSTDNCNGNLSFSFSSNLNDNSMVFDCNDLGINNYFLYVTDEWGNQDFCQGTVHLQDNFNLCPTTPGGGEIMGEIVTTTPEGVGMVNVKYNTSGGITDSVQTNGSGQFQIPVLSNITTITPEKDINLLNGVTTFDIVLMQKHILFVQTLDDPYLLIAADINNTGTITVSDAVALKKVILFIDDDFPNNDSWRFIDKSYVFPNPSDPWQVPFPESISINSNQPPFEAEFIGLKIGDLNGNADPGLFLNTDDRSFVEAVDFTVPNIQFKKGDIISIPFKLNNSNVAGYQFTLEFDEQSLAFSNIISGLSNQEDFGFKFLNEGYLMSSWTGKIEDENNEMFTLVFEAKSDGELKEMIQLTSELIQKEAYSNELEYLNIHLSFEEELNANQFTLLQNQPNPFSKTTTITFFLPEESNIEFRLYDSSGKVLKSARNFHQKGYNYLEINENELTGNGIYYFQLKNGKQIETRKMVLIK